MSSFIHLNSIVDKIKRSDSLAVPDALSPPPPLQLETRLAALERPPAHHVVSTRPELVNPGFHFSPTLEVSLPSLGAFWDLQDVTEYPSCETVPPIRGGRDRFIAYLSKTNSGETNYTTDLHRYPIKVASWNSYPRTEKERRERK